MQCKLKCKPPAHITLLYLCACIIYTIEELAEYMSFCGLKRTLHAIFWQISLWDIHSQCSRKLRMRVSITAEPPPKRSNACRFSDLLLAFLHAQRGLLYLVCVCVCCVCVCVCLSVCVSVPANLAPQATRQQYSDTSGLGATWTWLRGVFPKTASFKSYSAKHQRKKPICK